MIIKTSSGRAIDTERDLSAPERHILQKLFAWKSIVQSLKEFREKKDRSFHVGWNNTGSVLESHSMRLIIQDIEKEIESRLHHTGKSSTASQS
jgi:hypothetical protein